MTYIIGQKKEPIFEIPKRDYPLRKLKTISRYRGFVACRVANAFLMWVAPLHDKTSDRPMPHRPRLGDFGVIWSPAPLHST
jgi:hypothetical protein